MKKILVSGLLNTETITAVLGLGVGNALFSAFLHFYIKGYEVMDALYRAQVTIQLRTYENS